MTPPEDPTPRTPSSAAPYRVTIFYREPLYARTRDIPDLEHSGTFAVIAGSADDAMNLAIAKFKDAAQRSSVNWIREITRVSCSGPRGQSERTNFRETPRTSEPAAAPAGVLRFEETFERRPDVCDGEPVFRGTRVALRSVLASLARGDSIEDVLGAFPTLTPADLRAAIAFAASSAL